MTRPGEKNISFTIAIELYNKLFYIADANKRSGKGQITHLIRQCILEYERENGVITPKDLEFNKK